MKKLITTILTLLTCGTATALPVGNPAEASLYLNGALWDNSYCGDPCFTWCESFSFRVGYYGDFVFNRHLRGHHPTVGNSSAVRTTHIRTNAAYLVFNFCNRFDIFSTLGTTKIRMDADIASYGTARDIFSSRFVQLRFREQFSWSLGARATLWECDCFAIGAEGQYFQAKSRLDSLTDYQRGLVAHFGSESRRRYKEWQVGLGAAYRIATSCPTIAFVPYTAVKLARAKIERGNELYIDPIVPIATFVLPQFRSKLRWGWALGTTIQLCDVIGITAEGRWGDENALYINGQIRF